MGNGMMPRVLSRSETNFNRRGAPAAVMAPRDERAAPPRHGAPEQWAWDVATDGRRFLFVEAVADSTVAQPLTRVIHWLESR
jgi:hypothetical protein